MSNSKSKVKQNAFNKLTIGVASCMIGFTVISFPQTVHTNTHSVARMVHGKDKYDISDITKRLSDQRSGKHQLSKSEASFESAMSDIQKEIKEPHKEMISVYVLGDERALHSYIPIDRLKEIFKNDFEKNNYAFAKVDGHYLSNGSLYVMKKSGVVVNNLKEYQDVVKNMFVKNNGEQQDIYSSFELKHSFIELLLQANGLGMSGLRQSVIIDGVETHAQSLRLGTSAEYLNRREFTPLNKTLDDYVANDHKIIELIKKSNVLSYKTDAERVKAWSDFVHREFNYDSAAYNSLDGKDYNRASTIYSVFDNDKKAICVGFSSLSARAYNLMGIRSYVVYGMTAGGGAHAVTRVFFDNKWHFVDTTSSGNGSHYLLDTYSETERNPLRGEMVTHREFEKWMEKQRPRDLLLINKDIAEIDKEKSLDIFANSSETETFIGRIDYSISRYNYLITKLESMNSAPNVKNIISQSKHSINDLLKYRSELDDNNSLVKSYLESLEIKVKGLEDFAGLIESGFNITEFAKTDNSRNLLAKYKSNEVENTSINESISSQSENEKQEIDTNPNGLQDEEKQSRMSLVDEKEFEEAVVTEPENLSSVEAIDNSSLTYQETDVIESSLTTTLDVIHSIIATVWDDVSSWFIS